MNKFDSMLPILKALGDPIRLRILDMISCYEMCACDILVGLTISQSTLSHHMKVLTETNLVIARKDATWMYYSINRTVIAELHKMLDIITLPKDDCICNKCKKVSKK